MRSLTDQEAATVRAIADRIFPPTADGPGASAAGAAEFIDAQLAGDWGRGARLYRAGPFETPAHPGHGWQSPLTPVEAYRKGLAALEAYVAERHAGAGFAQLAAADQDAALEAMARGELSGAGGITSADLFALLRQSVVEALFADPIHGGLGDLVGWRWIGFPGDPDAYGDPYTSRIGRFGEPYAVEPRPLPRAPQG